MTCAHSKDYWFTTKKVDQKICLVQCITFLLWNNYHHGIYLMSSAITKSQHSDDEILGFIFVWDQHLRLKVTHLKLQTHLPGVNGLACRDPSDDGFTAVGQPCGTALSGCTWPHFTDVWHQHCSDNVPYHVILSLLLPCSFSIYWANAG